MKIVACHLLNDYSGSPKVLRQLANGWIENAYEVHIVSSLKNSGFLSDIRCVHYHDNPYRFAQNRWLRLWFLVWSQIRLVITMYPKISSEDTIYVNTVLPFGAAILGKLKGCKVIYHIHETSIKPWILKKCLFFIVRITASKVVYVSQYLSTEEPMHVPSTVLYNAIDKGFYTKATAFNRPKISPAHILMICSLKWYKGVDTFVSLARKNKSLSFRLVVNASMKEVEEYFQLDILPKNLVIFPTQSDVHPHYQWADIVMNLSNPDGWVETFGLTAIEAMAYSLPVIVPNIGGISEIVEDGVQGYQVDTKNIDEINEKLNILVGHPSLYQSMSWAASERIKDFDEGVFWKNSVEVIRD